MLFLLYPENLNKHGTRDISRPGLSNMDLSRYGQAPSFLAQVISRDGFSSRTDQASIPDYSYL